MLYNCTYVHSVFCYLLGIEATACCSISALLCFALLYILIVMRTGACEVGVSLFSCESW